MIWPFGYMNFSMSDPISSTFFFGGSEEHTVYGTNAQRRQQGDIRDRTPELASHSRHSYHPSYCFVVDKFNFVWTMFCIWHQNCGTLLLCWLCAIVPMQWPNIEKIVAFIVDLIKNKIYMCGSNKQLTMSVHWKFTSMFNKEMGIKSCSHRGGKHKKRQRSASGGYSGWIC